MTEEATPVFIPQIKKAQIIAWLTERMESCQKIAREIRAPRDLNVWQDDVEHFKMLIELVKSSDGDVFVTMVPAKKQANA